jgi:type I restriction enzyme R subunit
MYLDRRIKEAELLQAIARVNRTAEGKLHGLVVDYAGISKQLQEAMAAYAADEAEGAPKDFDEEIAKLTPRRDRLRMIFTQHNVTPVDSPEAIEACVQVLENDELRARFDVLLRRFLETVETVMPRRQVKPFLAEARLFALVSTWARARYEASTEFDISLYGERVRELIDRHVTALGVRQVIPPNRITADDFKSKVEALPGTKAQASTMEHAIRRHIEVYFNQDPAAYGRLRERLEQVLRDYAEQWEQQVLFFLQIVDEAVSVHEGGTEFVDPKLAKLTPLERALYGLVERAVANDAVLPPERSDAVLTLVGTIQATAYRHTRKKDFWSTPVNQRDLRTEIFRLLIDESVTAVEEARPMADELLEIVSHHRHALR